MSEKQIVHTEYGEVEVETAECDSCGMEYSQKNMKRYGIYNGRVTGSDVERIGWICTHCAGLDDPLVDVCNGSEQKGHHITNQAVMGIGNAISEILVKGSAVMLLGYVLSVIVAAASPSVTPLSLPFVVCWLFLFVLGVVVNVLTQPPPDLGIED